MMKLFLQVDYTRCRSVGMYDLYTKEVSMLVIPFNSGLKYPCQDKVYLGTNWFSLMYVDKEKPKMVVFKRNRSSPETATETGKVYPGRLMTWGEKDILNAGQILVFVQGGEKLMRFTGIKYHKVGSGETGLIRFRFAERCCTSSKVPAVELLHGGATLVFAMTFEMELRIVDLESGVVRSLSNRYMRVITNTPQLAGEARRYRTTFYGGKGILIKAKRPNERQKLTLMTFDGKGAEKGTTGLMRQDYDEMPVEIILEEGAKTSSSINL
jgi:hypothetical protein